MWSLGAGSRMRYGANAITAVHGFYVQLVDFAARLEERGAILATVCPEVARCPIEDPHFNILRGWLQNLPLRSNLDEKVFFGGFSLR